MPELPYILVADERGNIKEDKTLRVVGRESNKIKILNKEDFILLPEGSDFFFLPGRIPVGLNTNTNKVELSKRGYAVAAFVAPAHTHTSLAAFVKKNDAPVLPLFAYTAIGWLKGKFYTTAVRIDPDIRQDFSQFNQSKVIAGTKQFQKRYPANRLVKHLVHCATVYFCPAARNYFLNRWEAPLPTSPTCNSRCRGCISYQPKDSGFCSTQNRISFVPTPEEIAEIAIDHLNTASNPVVSFGQGCEGEPLLVGDVIAEAIKLIRQRTKAGIININTNGSKADKIDKLIENGLDSARISMNSFRKDYYNWYYSPINYEFKDVIESIKLLRKSGKWVSINYFVHPGHTNHPEEISALKSAIENLNFNMIQWRNFNIDPDFIGDELNINEFSNEISIRILIDNIKREYPKMYHGYFNPNRQIIEKYL
ncbi:MAG: radical SAM protein [Bacteroidales bacterium]|nr:radical SAM protein [Bacteroidales bacterium]HOL98994.1 radical SAM protein [Bacteroidales bacterium]HOM37298.1 radical SAM protein [Bacteroidales bacterium]HPD24806.1 radical SAM protein [Bacteroidales bacterium]HRT00584.1 radical SAM protein [Bacteroidales bacterium]